MKPDFNKTNGLLPVMIQDAVTMQVLMLGYMNEEAFKKTQKEQKVTFFSRSKNRLWTKGETSGNFLWVKEMFLDCDEDTLLIFAKADGPTCHKGTVSCFDNQPKKGFLYRLEQTIHDRIDQNIEGSYTNQLYQKGINNFKAPLVKLFVLYENEQVTVPLSEQLSEQLSVQQTAQLPVHIYKLITDNIETINNRQDEFLCLIKNFINPKSKVIDLSFLQKDFIPVVEKWLLYKKEKKQEYKGQTSINTFCKKLIEYSNGDAIIAEAIIEQSIANNWAGIFELKNNNNGNKQQNGLDADAQWRAEMEA